MSQGCVIFISGATLKSCFITQKFLKVDFRLYHLEWELRMESDGWRERLAPVSENLQLYNKWMWVIHSMSLQFSLAAGSVLWAYV